MAALTHPRPRNGTRPSNGQPDSLITWTTTPTKSEPILADAPDGVSTYLQAGWSIIPASIEGKRGLVPWKRYQQAPPSPEQFTSWAHRWPRCNWAIITGRLSGVVVVDVDPRAGGDRALAELEQRHGDLPW